MTVRTLFDAWGLEALIVAEAVLACIAVLCTAFPELISGATGLRNDCIIVMAAVPVALAFTAGLPERLRVVLRIAAMLAFISFLFQALAGLQHLVTPGWRDEELIAIDRALFGMELSVWMQRLTTPVLTEWFMASYVLYVPLLAVIAWVCYRRSGEQVVYSYLNMLLAVNIACGIGFVLYPVASQMYHAPGQYTVPLIGGPFTFAAEWMRSNVHYPGGSLPSPHCAAGTVMLVFVWRHHRRLALVLAPILLSILPATVYGRYHYVWDGIAGIVAAALVLLSAPLARATLSAMQRGIARCFTSPNPSTIL